ncbi:hypothetical protein AVEN_186897-1 [Araneus ventricosus]|uniref:Uncharacterized protein n=1 Tax=Araneus ventricosus TaxID=182803 RepID=A0A4Y2PV84_ARAVE|nr:hypothetical protein AVEN_186897-1 [Araneus ventricosus]
MAGDPFPPSPATSTTSVELEPVDQRQESLLQDTPAAESFDSHKIVPMAKQDRGTQTNRVCWQQQVLISHVYGTLSDKESSRKETKDKVLYSQAVAKGSDRDRSRSRPKKQFNVIIYPKRDQNSDNTKKDIQSKISPSKISVRVNSVKNIKKGGILINNPSIVIFQVDEQLTKEEVLEGLKIQNEDLAEATLEARTSFKVKTGKIGSSHWIRIHFRK